MASSSVWFEGLRATSLGPFLHRVWGLGWFRVVCARSTSCFGALALYEHNHTRICGSEVQDFDWNMGIKKPCLNT